MGSGVQDLGLMGFVCGWATRFGKEALRCGDRLLLYIIYRVTYCPGLAQGTI